MEQTTQPNVVGVRFSKVGKVYHFSAANLGDVKIGDMVVVETSRGWQLGQVSQVVENAEPPPDGWKSIDRRATPRDLLLRQMWQMKEADVVLACQSRTAELRLSGVKIASAEYSFDGSRLMILFSTETEEKYDLKSLRQDMQKLYAPSQVELRQVGPRDVAKILCGMGACGLETRCCCLFLTEFSSISIRMAKEQGISLTPSEITGMCGRLRCCLIYEYDSYVDARSSLPKRNKLVRTPQGVGKVVDIVPLRDSVIVEIPEVGRKEFLGSDVFPADDASSMSIDVPDKGNQQEAEPDLGTNVDRSVVTNRMPSSPDKIDFPKVGSKDDATQRLAGKNFPPRRNDRAGRRPMQRNTDPVDTKQNIEPGKGGKQQINRRPDPRWKKKPEDTNRPSSQLPDRPKPQTNDVSQTRTNKDQRRKKGNRRDFNDDKNRT